MSRGEPGTRLLKSRDGHLEGGKDFLQAKIVSSSPRLFPAPNPKEHSKNTFRRTKVGLSFRAQNTKGVQQPQTSSEHGNSRS